jgi:hypothetical protein
MTTCTRQRLGEFIACLLILLLVYTATSKLLNEKQFHAALWSLPLIGEGAYYLAYLIPSVELLVALLLFFPSTRSWGLWSSFVLLIFFTLYMGYMLVFAAYLPCSCGGVISRLGWKQHVVFNIVFILLAYLGARWQRSATREEHPLLFKVKDT